MIASKGMMQAILAQYRNTLRNCTHINLYKGAPPTDDILQQHGFVYSTRSADLLSSITIPVNSFEIQAVEVDRKWRFVFSIGNLQGVFSADGDVSFAVIGNGTSQWHASVCSTGTSDDEILRLNTLGAVSGQPVIASTFNLVIERNLQP